MSAPRRLAPVVPMRVEWRAGADRECVEMTSLLSVNSRGATFALSQQPHLGQLLHLTLPVNQLPDKGISRDGRHQLWALVWALIAQPNKIRERHPPAPTHTVSVVFVGEDLPVSFDKTQESSYSYVAEEDGCFRLQRETAASSGDLAHTHPRKESRIHVPMEVTVELLDENGMVTASELTVTENISRRGAAVWTTLDVRQGCGVRMTCARNQISVPGVVRARRVGEDGIARLHIEFTDIMWPLEGLR
ncbi:MAG: PilZ domain-containing protein [Pyrinomonadaceae bacterium]